MAWRRRILLVKKISRKPSINSGIVRPAIVDDHKRGTMSCSRMYSRTVMITWRTMSSPKEAAIDTGIAAPQACMRSRSDNTMSFRVPGHVVHSVYCVGTYLQCQGACVRRCVAGCLHGAMRTVRNWLEFWHESKGPAPQPRPC